jgi:hypothetical protein
VAPEFSAPHALTLLRAYSDGPRDRQAIRNRDELAPSHVLLSPRVAAESGFVRCGNMGCQLTAGSRTDQSATSVLGLLICTEQTLEHCEIGSVKRENRDLPRRCEHLVGARAA